MWAAAVARVALSLMAPSQLQQELTQLQLALEHLEQ
jgi:hypothetical protein